MHELAFHGGRVDDGEIMRLCDSHEALRTQVSALRQEAAALKAALDTEVEEVVAARQEAETLTRQRDAAIREISVIAREAETLRKQLGEAVQAADDANQEEAFVRRALDYQALDYEALSREAETLRSQLDAAQKALGTEQTMHRAWRKRAEEAEAERTPTGLSAELTPLTDEQRDAFDDFVRASLETDKEVIAKLRRELLERNFPRAARVAVPREPT
jgi:chromosome segregation ATPase